MEIVTKLIEDIKENGITVKAGVWQATELFKDHEMLVLYNTHLRFPMVKPTVEELQEEIKPNLPWAEDHFQERIGGEPTNPGKTYKYWPYNNFKEENDPYQDGKKFSHTYQERFWPKEAGDLGLGTQGIRYDVGDLNDVIGLLRTQPLTRQAYLPIWFPEDTGAVNKQRVPCSLGYLFYLVNNNLHCNYYIRSCDAFRHLRNDIYLASRLILFISEQLPYKPKPGDLNMYIANLHLFKNDIYPVTQKEKKINGKDN